MTNAYLVTKTNDFAERGEIVRNRKNIAAYVKVVIFYDLDAYDHRNDIAERQVEDEMQARFAYNTARHPLEQLPAGRDWNRVVETAVRFDSDTRETDRRLFNAMLPTTGETIEEILEKKNNYLSKSPLPISIETEARIIDKFGDIYGDDDFLGTRKKENIMSNLTTTHASEIHTRRQRTTYKQPGDDYTVI